MTKLITLLNSLEENILLNDSAQTWDVDNLIDACLEYPEMGNQEVSETYTRTGLLTIYAVKKDGYIDSVPLYCEEEEE